jgi:hypothetical protein
VECEDDTQAYLSHKARVSRDPEQQKNILLPGQMYITAGEGEDIDNPSIVEIKGFTSDDVDAEIYIQRWKGLNEKVTKIRQGTYIYPVKQQNRLGAATMEKVKFETIFSLSPSQLVTTECGEDKMRIGDRRAVLGWHKTNIPIRSLEYSLEHIDYWSNGLVIDIKESFPEGFDIFVDGAWSKGDDSEGEIFLLPSHKKTIKVQHL